MKATIIYLAISLTVLAFAKANAQSVNNQRATTSQSTNMQPPKEGNTFFLEEKGILVPGYTAKGVIPKMEWVSFLTKDRSNFRICYKEKGKAPVTKKVMRYEDGEGSIDFICMIDFKESCAIGEIELVNGKSVFVVMFTKNGDNDAKKYMYFYKVDILKTCLYIDANQ